MLPTLAWETYRNHRIEICPDPDSEDPLCEGVKIVSFHRRRGKRHGFETPEQVLHYAKIHKAAALPLWFYDHSRFVLSLTPFNDPWDSGAYGFLLVERKTLEYHRLNRRKKLLAFAQGEIEAYNRWINGEVYQYLVWRDNKVVYACAGYWEMEEALESAREEIDWHLEKEQAAEG
jgi:hypothetical protein